MLTSALVPVLAIAKNRRKAQNRWLKLVNNHS